MTYESLLDMIHTFPALFFTLWLGIVGTPIPDEVIVMTGCFQKGRPLDYPSEERKR